MAFGRRAGAFSALRGGLGWGWFEAGWVRLRELELDGAGAAARARRPADRASLRLPPRRAVAAARARSSAAVDWAARAAARSRRDHRRPADAPARRAAPARARRAAAAAGRSRCSAITTSRSRATRRRARRTCASSSRRALLRDEGELLELRGRTVWIAGVDPRLIVRGRRRSTRTRSRAMPTSASCSATTRACSTGSSRGASSSCSRVTCTTARSRSRIRAARCGSRIRRRATRRGVYRAAGGGDARLAGPRDDVRAVPLRGAARGDGAGATFAL